MREAIGIYDTHGNINEFEKREEAKEKLVKDWKEYTAQNPGKSSLMLTYSNADVAELNHRAARAENKAQGKLGPEEHMIIMEKGPRAFAEGDRIIFLENNKTMDAKNGSLGTVLKIDAKAPDKSFLIKLDKEKTVFRSP